MLSSRSDQRSVSLLRRRADLVILQRAPCGTIQILELIGVQRPQEGRKTKPSEEERNRNKPGKGCHLHTFRRFDLRRTAFAVTAMDELDMAIAAISGVA